MALLEMAGVSKAFPGVLALDSVSFSVDRGEIRALMGENGAGKSTLIKVLTGVYASGSGTVLLDGVSIAPRSPAHAQELGVSTVYQEVNLVPNLSVAENVCLGYEPRTFGKINWRKVNERARRAMSRLNIDIDVTRSLTDFSTAVQQLVAIARAVDREAKVLVLDEPTSSLDKIEVERLFTLMRKLRGDGMAIVFVTHFLEQVYSVADSVTVLRNGVKVGDWAVTELPRQKLVAQMLGRDLDEVPHVDHREAIGTDVLVTVESLGRKNAMEPISFDVRRGETLGLSGLLGSGRTETMKMLSGANPADSGVISVSGIGTRGSRLRPRSPRDSIRLGIGLCPEDRKSEGVCPGLSVSENLLLVLQARRGWLRVIRKKQADKIVSEQIERLRITTPDTRRPIENLSGGNQQKVLLCRWLVAEPTLLLLDEPTRGIDVGNKLEIRKLITDLAKKGMSFVFSSAELEEVVNTCDRVVVLRDRRKVGELKGAEVTEQNVMARIAEGEA
jgi:simple sugar transport system ATP-binding protein